MTVMVPNFVVIVLKHFSTRSHFSHLKKKTVSMRGINTNNLTITNS